MNLVGSEALVKSGVINTVVFPSFKFSSDDDAAPIWPPSPMVRSEFSQHLSIHHPSHAPKHCSLDQAAVYIYTRGTAEKMYLQIKHKIKKLSLNPKLCVST